jgi:hypothetical protein
VVLLAGLGAAATYSGLHGGLGLSFDPGGAGCRFFWGQTVDTVAWSGSGDYLAVLTEAQSDGEMETRVFRWPGMVLLSQTKTDTLASSVAVADDGSILWAAWDSFGGSTTLWRRAIERTAEALGTLPDGRYSGIFWAAGSLVATEHDLGPPERSRLVKLSLDDLRTPTAVTPWTTRGQDFWIDPTGHWATWTESDGPGTPESVVVRNDDQEQRLPLPGYGGRVPSVVPAHDAVLYQRVETSRLTLLDLSTGTVRGELDSGQFFGGEVSSSGILAASTAHGPWQGNELCVLDVRYRLKAGVSGG